MMPLQKEKSQLSKLLPPGFMGLSCILVSFRSTRYFGATDVSTPPGIKTYIPYDAISYP